LSENIKTTRKPLEALLVVGTKIDLEVLRKRRQKGKVHPRTGHEGPEGE
jgi:hypothetical protein